MNIFEKLLNIQSELKAPKSQYNSFGKYSYRNSEDILEALKPLLVENKATIFIKDDIIHIEGRFYIKATVTFIDVETGDKIENTALAREEENLKGQIGSQITGGTSSYARKYALNGMFAIDDTKDADSFNDGDKSNGSHTEPNKPIKSPKKYISDAQVKRLLAIAYKKGYNKEKVEDAVKTKLNCKISELNKEQYDLVVKGYEKLEDK